MKAAEVAKEERLRLGMPSHLAANLLTAVDALRHRRGPEPERRRDPREQLRAGVVVAGEARVRRRLLERLGGRGGMRFVPVQPRLESPGAAKTRVIVFSLENRQDALHHVGGFADASAGDAPQPQELLMDENARFSLFVARLLRGLHRTVEDALGLLELTFLDERRAELGEQADPVRAVRHNQSRGAPEQPDRGVKVAARERPAPGRT